MAANDPWIVEVEGALGWRRRHYEGGDRDKAARVARILASRDGADRVTRVLRRGWVYLEILGWSKLQHGLLAAGPTAREPLAAFPDTTATLGHARRRGDPPSELVLRTRERPPGVRPPGAKGQLTFF